MSASGVVNERNMKYSRVAESKETVRLLERLSSTCINLFFKVLKEIEKVDTLLTSVSIENKKIKSAKNILQHLATSKQEYNNAVSDIMHAHLNIAEIQLLNRIDYESTNKSILACLKIYSYRIGEGNSRLQQALFKLKHLQILMKFITLCKNIDASPYSSSIVSIENIGRISAPSSPLTQYCEYLASALSNLELNSNQCISSVATAIVYSHFYTKGMYQIDQIYLELASLMKSRFSFSFSELFRKEKLTNKQNANTKILSFMLIFKEEKLSREDRAQYLAHLSIILITHLYQGFKEDMIEKYIDRISEIKRVYEILDAPIYILDSINQVLQAVTYRYEEINGRHENNIGDDENDDYKTITKRTMDSKATLIKANLFINMKNAEGFDQAFNHYRRKRKAKKIKNIEDILIRENPYANLESARNIIMGSTMRESMDERNSLKIKPYKGIEFDSVHLKRAYLESKEVTARSQFSLHKKPRNQSLSLSKRLNSIIENRGTLNTDRVLQTERVIVKRNPYLDIGEKDTISRRPREFKGNHLKTTRPQSSKHGNQYLSLVTKDIPSSTSPIRSTLNEKLKEKSDLRKYLRHAKYTREDNDEQSLEEESKATKYLKMKYHNFNWLKTKYAIERGRENGLAKSRPKAHIDFIEKTIKEGGNGLLERPEVRKKKLNLKKRIERLAAKKKRIITEFNLDKRPITLRDRSTPLNEFTRKYSPFRKQLTPIPHPSSNLLSKKNSFLMKSYDSHPSYNIVINRNATPGLSPPSR